MKYKRFNKKNKFNIVAATDTELYELRILFEQHKNCIHPQTLQEIKLCPKFKQTSLSQA